MSFYIIIAISLKTFIIIVVNTALADSIIIRISRVSIIIFFFFTCFSALFLWKQWFLKHHIKVIGFEFYFFFKQTSLR